MIYLLIAIIAFGLGIAWERHQRKAGIRRMIAGISKESKA